MLYVVFCFYCYISEASNIHYDYSPLIKNLIALGQHAAHIMT